MQLTGNPPETALFDPQLAGALNKDWLIDRAAIEEGVESRDAEQLLAEGLILWKDGRGGQGFIPYSTRQAGVFMQLKATGALS